MTIYPNLSLKLPHQNYTTAKMSKNTALKAVKGGIMGWDIFLKKP